jgi:hypothetical protein
VQLRLKFSLRLRLSLGLSWNLWLSLSLNLCLSLRGNLLRKTGERQRTDQSHSRDAHTETGLVSAKPMDALHKGRIVNAKITFPKARVKHIWSKWLIFSHAEPRARRGKWAIWHATATAPVVLRVGVLRCEDNVIAGKARGCQTDQRSLLTIP